MPKSNVSTQERQDRRLLDASCPLLARTTENLCIKTGRRSGYPQALTEYGL